jgi:hypothetical protein
MDRSYEPLPLVIGVTGHRDLRDEDIPHLEAAVAEVFDRLKREFLDPKISRLGRMWRNLRGTAPENVGTTPVILLSSLAEGADQLVARVALEKNIRLLAPLPLPLEEYRRDFEIDPVKPDALKDFDAWVTRTDITRPFFVGYENDDAAADVQHNPDKRALQYRRVGVFIARHCDVLIALWDGNTGATGGTAEIVDFKRHGIPLDVTRSGRASLDAPEIGPVIHIVTPRAKKEKTAPGVSIECWGTELMERYEALDTARKRPPNTQAEKQKIETEIGAIKHDYLLWRSFEAPIRQSVEFNREAACLLAKKSGHDRTSQSLAWLFNISEKHPDTAPRDKALNIAPRYCDLYAVADALAQKWQTQFRKDWFLLFALGLFAFGCFEVFSHLVPVMERPHHEMTTLVIDIVLLSGYVIAFSAIFGFHNFARKRHHQERFLDYRALAEALRVAVFLKLLDIKEIADAYPIKQPRELAWVKTCLLTQELLDAAEQAASVAPDETTYRWTRRIWVDGQWEYFRAKSPSHLESAEWRENWSKRILIAAVILALVLGCLTFMIAMHVRFDPLESAHRRQWAHDLFLFVIGALPAVAAVLVGHSEKLAFNAQSRQYDRMAELFGRALELLPEDFAKVDEKLARATFRELGTEAMREHAEWVSIYRQRPISLPQG